MQIPITTRFPICGKGSKAIRRIGKKEGKHPLLHLHPHLSHMLWDIHASYICTIEAKEVVVDTLICHLLYRDGRREGDDNLVLSKERAGG